MKIDRFEDSIGWQKSKEMTLLLYEYTNVCKDHAYNDQIRRASVSIMNNIAEGFERQTDKEFIQFLYIAKGSCGEVRSMLYIALERKYMTQGQFQFTYDLSIEISKILSGLITSLRKSQ